MCRSEECMIHIRGVGVLNNCFITIESGSTIWVSDPFSLSQCKSKVLIFLQEPKHNQGTHTWVFLLQFAYHNKRHVLPQWQILVTSKYLFYYNKTNGLPEGNEQHTTFFPVLSFFIDKQIPCNFRVVNTPNTHKQIMCTGMCKYLKLHI